MVHALRQKVTVKPGGVVELRSPELVPGSIVEVIILQEKEYGKTKNLAELIGAGKGVFNTPEEADEFIRRERDKWDQ
jgi:hypothetical protein